MKTWDLEGEPLAYVREGDSDEYRDLFKEQGCNVENHRLGYRSVHYILNVAPTKAAQFVELQVRTIFEEGWSEIDHRFRYPHNPDVGILNQFQAIFNRLAGSADEMGSFVGNLQQWAQKYGAIEKQHEASKAKLSDLITALEVSEAKKAELQEQLNKLEDQGSLLSWAVHSGQVMTIVDPTSWGMPVMPKISLYTPSYEGIKNPPKESRSEPKKKKKKKPETEG
jgi:hypothetical protein